MIVTNLLTNMFVLTLHGVIPTNTPAFQAAISESLLAKAQVLAAKWHLDEGTIASNKITYFEAIPYPAGPGAFFQFGHRYVFGASDGGFIGFTDQSNYFPIVFNATTNKEEDVKRYQTTVKAWSSASNLLTLAKAQAIAESAMRSYSVPITKMGFKKPTLREQKKWKDDYRGFVSNGWVYRYELKRPVTYKLPYYEFEWESSKGYCRVHVSGLTSNLVHFSFSPYRGAIPESDYLRLGTPTNYLQLLGLPANAVFLKRYMWPKTYRTLEPGE